MPSLITEDQGRQLLRLARETITEAMSNRERMQEYPVDTALLAECGTFVTLTLKGQLRGCIGNLEPSGTIYEGVRRNALNAAFHDYRFSPLTVEELEKIRIDISILSRPTPLAYHDGPDLMTQVRPGIDGVIVRLGRNSATFLPQVWKQLPEVELFLGHLCRKAGLADTAWRNSHPEIETYQVQCFEEGT